jgi:hypothetical protein
MAVWSEFEEKEFETLANVSFVTEQLVRRRKRKIQVFSPGQFLEKTLGFDFAAHLNPHSRLHRRLFGSTPGAPGATPSQLAQLKMPLASSTKFLNVFLQYKRPEHFKTGHRSPLWSKKEEFLRFTVSEGNVNAPGYHFDQITALDALAVSLGSQAMVRYACPVVWTKAELYGIFDAGRLLENTVFVEPSRLIDATGAADPYHRRWTFQRSAPGAGKPNPDGALTAAESGETFLDNLEFQAENSPSADGFTQRLIEDAKATQNARALVNASKEKLRARDRRRLDLEDLAIQEDLERLPLSRIEPVERSLELASIGRDLGVQWSIVALD